MKPLIILLPIAGLVGYRTFKAMTLKHFKLSDFRGLHVFLSYGVMESLDKFAELMDPSPVIISPAPGTIVRFATKVPNNKDHFYGRAIDVMLPDRNPLSVAYNNAIKAGFNAVGIYPYWRPYKGLHLAQRPPLDKVYSWSDVGVGGKHVYTSLEKGFMYG